MKLLSEPGRGEEKVLIRDGEKCVSVNPGHDTTLFLEVVICFRMFLADI